ncbi:MAG: Crp/Fnr family transcriptional regulator [Nitrospirae bacterium]|nr:Crp/Fnr family transcriptional regulator [Nitrospirota bacterium]
MTQKGKDAAKPGKKDVSVGVDRAGKLLRGLPFFASLTDKEFSEVTHIRRDIRFLRGQTILSEEDTHKYMYIVLSGKVKAVHFGPDGKEHILAFHNRGEFFGEMAVLDGKTAPAAVVAVEDTEISLISKKDFDAHMMTNQKICRQIIDVLCSRLREAWMMLIALTLPDAEDKVRAVLKLVSMQIGIRDSRGTIIASNLTHQDIADYASVSRETVTRLLTKLIKAGEIEIIGKRDLLLRPLFMERSNFLLP